jgi:CelD/BcsL family acetyltransferase involved in cellulose biosynthesis
VCRRRDGEIAAVLPLYFMVHRGPARVARFIGHGPADQLGPVCAPGDRFAAAQALREVVSSALGRSGMLLAERLPRNEGWTPILGGRVVHREATPRLAIDGQDWDGWLSSKSRNFREQVRRRERKLAREHDVNLRLITSPDETAVAFQTLLALHEARWVGGSRAFAGARLRFHRDFLQSAAARGWARIWILKVDGRAAAAWYGWRFGEADWYYQAGRIPEFDQVNVGFVLLCHTSRDAFAAGRREYRFLLGDDPYKTRFFSDDPGLDTLAVSTGPAAVAAHGAATMARSVPGAVRRRVRRVIA